MSQNPNSKAASKSEAEEPLDLSAEASARESQFKAKAKNGSDWKQATCGSEPNFFTIYHARFVAPLARAAATGRSQLLTIRCLLHLGDFDAALFLVPK